MKDPDRSPTLGRNVLSGAVTNASMAAVHFVYTGVCAFLLGAEAFGIVAFSTTVLMTLVFLNQFTSPVVVRSLGADLGNPERASHSWAVLKTFEAVSIVIGVVVGAAIFALAPLIAHYGLKATSISPEIVLVAVRLIGLQIACQWPSFLYRAGFIGIGRQDLFALIAIPSGIIQYGGALLLLWAAGPSLIALFSWMSAAYLVQSLLLRQALQRSMPRLTGRPTTSLDVLSAVWRFSTGTLIIGITASLLTQTDKLVISTSVPLAEFSAYSVASMLAIQVVTVVASPITVSLLPRFSAMIAANEQQMLASEYRRWTQTLAALMLPIAGALFAFSRPIMQLWLGRSSPLIDSAIEFMPLFSIGTMFNIFAIPPYILQMSSGWSSLLARFNACAWLLMLAALFVLVPRIGAIAGAYCWIALNVGYYVVLVALMHRKLLRDRVWSWWTFDTLLPFAANFALFTASQRLFSEPSSLAWSLAQAAITVVGGWLLLALILPAARSEIVKLGVRAVHVAAH